MIKMTPVAATACSSSVWEKMFKSTELLLLQTVSLLNSYSALYHKKINTATLLLLLFYRFCFLCVALLITTSLGTQSDIIKDPFILQKYLTAADSISGEKATFTFFFIRSSNIDLYSSHQTIAIKNFLAELKQNRIISNPTDLTNFMPCCHPFGTTPMVSLKMWLCRADVQKPQRTKYRSHSHSQRETYTAALIRLCFLSLLKLSATV